MDAQATAMKADTRSWEATPQQLSRLGGFLYLVIIFCGVTSEVLMRGPLIEAGSAADTAENLRAASNLFRASILMDVAMTLADVALAAVLYVLLEPVGRVLSLAAMVFRLVQAAILGMNMLHLHRAVTLSMTAESPSEQSAVLGLLDAHAAGYDFGLFFFGVNCLIVGLLLSRAAGIPRALGPMIAISGAVYLVGSGLRVLSPASAAAFEPAYLLPLVAELWLCLWLIIKGVGVEGLRPQTSTLPTHA